MDIVRRMNDNQEHHTTGDWDFMTGDWELDTVVFVSSPSSLHHVGVGVYPVVLCKKAGTTVLNEGRIVTQARLKWGTNTLCRVVFTFRNQKAVGGADIDDCYKLWFNAANSWSLEYMTGGAWESMASGAGFLGGWTIPNNEFVKWRCTWWEDGGVLYIRVERWTGTEWTRIINDIAEGNNYYSGEAVNRCGFRLNAGTAAEEVWYDDTEIWGPS